MPRTARALAALATATFIIYAAVGPAGGLWDRPFAWVGLAMVGVGLLAMHTPRVAVGDDGVPRD